MSAELFIFLIDALLFIGFVAVIVWIVYILLVRPFRGRNKSERKH